MAFLGHARGNYALDDGWGAELDGDERVKHSGMPAVGEKYLATQWVHESSENANRFSAQKKEEQNKEDRLGQAKNAPFLPEDDDDF